MLQEYQQSARYETSSCRKKGKCITRAFQKEGEDTNMCKMAEHCSPAVAIKERQPK